MLNVLETMVTENTPGLSIAYFGKGVLEWSKCYGTMDNESKEEVTANSIFHACSMTKMVSAICILKLHQENRLNIYNEVNHYLKSWKMPLNEYNKNTPVTIVDLLAHQGGISDPEGSFEPLADNEFPKNLDILCGITPYNSIEVHTSYMPQSKFDYSDAGYAVLEMLVEDISGKKYKDFVEENIFMPLELKNTFLWSNDYSLSDSCVVGHDKAGHTVNGKRAIYPNVGGAGLWTTPTDFSAIVIDLLRSFTSDSGLLVNKEIATLIFSPYGCVDFAGLGVFLGVSHGKPYLVSQGWGVGMQCKVIAFLDDQTGAVVMMNSEPGKDQSQSIVGMVLRDILDIEGE